jgi:trans-aconitate 2-methyltransferase
VADAWNPAQYDRFKAERMLPFYELMRLVKPREGMDAIDLGCGTGEQTSLLQEKLPRSKMLGIDTSAAMLLEAHARTREGLYFRQQDIASIRSWKPFALVFSNAALHWVPDHEKLFVKMLGELRPGAQVAIQVPRNEAHPSHRIAQAVMKDPAFAGPLAGFEHKNHSLPLERYAELLWAFGFREQTCFEKIYGHELASTGEVVEWVKGTTLTGVFKRLPDDAAREAFVAAYEKRLLAEVGEHAPYFFAFRRLLFWGRRTV